MNRSVINSTIAAAVLCTGCGLAVAVPAAAEPSPPALSNGSDPATGDSGPRTRGPRSPGRVGKAGQNTGASGGSATGWIPPWPCPWPPIPTPVIPPDPGPQAGGGGAGIPALPHFAAPVVPQAQLSGGVLRAVPAPGELDNVPELATAPENIAPPGSVAPSVSAPGAPVWNPPVWNAAPAMAPSPVPLWPPQAPRPVAPPPASPAAVAPPARVLPPSPAAPQAGAADMPETVRAGYPEGLRTADSAALVARALPGLAVILGMTAAGGFLGYRQAKAGSALRAAGAGRFLR